MGLSAGAIYISEPKIGREVAIQLGLLDINSSPIENSDTGFEIADGLRIGVVEGQWSVILGSPDALLSHMEHLSDKLTDLSQGRKIFFWYTQSASGGVIFEIHENGELLRKWVEAEGQVFEEIGEPLSEEEGLVDRENHEGGPLHSEFTVLQLAEKITGISADQHFEMNGSVYAAAPCV